MEHRLWDQEHLESIAALGFKKKTKNKTENVGIALDNWVKDNKSRPLSSPTDF